MEPSDAENERIRRERKKLARLNARMAKLQNMDQLPPQAAFQFCAAVRRIDGWLEMPDDAIIQLVQDESPEEPKP